MNVIGACGMVGILMHWRVRLRLSCANVGTNDVQVVLSGCQRLLGITLRDKSGVVVECGIPLPSKLVKDSQQTGVLLVQMSPYKLYDCYVVSWLAADT